MTMSSIAGAFDGTMGKTRVYRALLLSGLAVASLFSSVLALAGTKTAVLAAVALFGLLLLLYGSLFRPWGVIAFIFIFASFEGFIKHKMGYALLTYVFKDAIMLALMSVWLLKALTGRHGAYRRTPLDMTITLFTIVCLIQVFNPNFENWIISIAGIKVHLVYVPLYYMGYYLLQDRLCLTRLARLFAALVVIMGVYGIVQYLQGPESVSNLGPSFAEIVRRDTWWAGTKHYFRPMSFAATGGLASSFYMIGFPFVALSAILSRQRWEKALWGVSLLALTVALVLTGVRSSLLTLMVAGILMSLIFSRRMLLPLAIVIFIGIAVSMNLGGGQIGHRMASMSNPYQSFMTNRMRFITVVPELVANYPVGMGLARTGAAAGALSKFFPDYDRMTLDNYLSSMVFETSLLGASLILAVFLIILYQGAVIIRRSSGEARAVAMALYTVPLSIFIAGFSGPTLTISPHNIYFWLSAGLLLKLPHIYAALGAESAQCGSLKSEV
ncbi:MAG: hypothetical protein PHT33_03360 [bacterium]|nr:hypothetical protein [bacterium]